MAGHPKAGAGREPLGSRASVLECASPLALSSGQTDNSKDEAATARPPGRFTALMLPLEGLEPRAYLKESGRDYRTPRTGVGREPLGSRVSVLECDSPLALSSG